MPEPIDDKNNLPPAPGPDAPAEAAAPKRSFFARGFLKGLAVTAIAVVAAMALVIGTMGTGATTHLTVNGSMVSTFFEGMGHGISEAGRFLATSWIGLGTLVAGGALGAYREYKNEQKQAAAASDSAEHTKLIELTQELAVQKSLNQQLIVSQDKVPQQAPKDEAKPAPVAPAESKPAPPKREGITLAGSKVSGSEFEANELKRRAERSEAVAQGAHV